MSDNILKQLYDLKGLMCSYRHDLDKQQQEIVGPKSISHTDQSHCQGNWNLPLNHAQAK